MRKKFYKLGHPDFAGYYHITKAELKSISKDIDKEYIKELDVETFREEVAHQEETTKEYLEYIDRCFKD